MKELWDETEHVAQKLRTLLNSTGLYECVDTHVARKEVQFLGRVHRDKEKDFVHLLAKDLLFLGESLSMSVFICKQFFLKKEVEGSKFVHGWAIALSGEVLVRDDVEELYKVIEQHIPEPPAVEEQLILARKPVQQLSKDGKGARPV